MTGALTTIMDNQPNSPPISVLGLAVTAQQIEETKQSIALLKKVVREILVQDIDYGSVPGLPGMMLFDPGANTIANIFNCYCGERKVIKLDSDGDNIVCCIEVPVISRLTGKVVGSGIAASSTLESKHRYIWVVKPQDYGFSQEAIDGFSAKRKRPNRDTGEIEYKIERPDRAELINAIVKQASKRAECDAVQELPGVAAALRELLGKKYHKPGDTKKQEGGINFSAFWAECRHAGWEPAQVHAYYKVRKIEEHFAAGHTPEEVLAYVRAHKPEPGPRDPKTLKTLEQAFAAIQEDFGVEKWKTLQELGVRHEIEIKETPARIYIQIAELHK